MARRQQQADRALRPAMRSPGRPMPARHLERAFWRLIAQGKRTEEAALQIGVSTPVAVRWFRHAGGMPPLSLAEPTGRYLSFAEREELALLKAQGRGVRAIARALKRDPGTISREVRRNAATRGGKREYRAGVAQWKAQTAARRPKPAKLAFGGWPTPPRAVREPVRDGVVSPASAGRLISVAAWRGAEGAHGRAERVVSTRLWWVAMDQVIDRPLVEDPLDSRRPRATAARPAWLQWASSAWRRLPCCRCWSWCCAGPSR